MRTEKDVEAYLLRLGRRYRSLDDSPGTFVLDGAGSHACHRVRVEAPLVVLRVHIGDIVTGNATGTQSPLPPICSS